MDFLKEFEKTMESSATMALATAADNTPNVRIVTFCYDEKNKGVVYFTTFKGSPKTKEFEQNEKVAFTTIPMMPGSVVRVCDAVVKKSSLTVADIKEGIIKKYPSYEATAQNVGHLFDVYEIHFKEAIVTINPQNIGVVTL